MANIITASRILLSFMLLFARTFSPAFIAVYVLAGLTDMVDGTVARKTGTASGFGAKLDTIADICFLTVAACKLFPVIRVPFWLWLWTGGIAVVKIANIVAGFTLWGEFPAVHTVENKAVGLLLFLLPLSVSFVKPVYGASLVCAMATFAALRERRYIKTRKYIPPGQCTVPSPDNGRGLGRPLFFPFPLLSTRCSPPEPMCSAKCSRRQSVP